MIQDFLTKYKLLTVAVCNIKAEKPTLIAWFQIQLHKIKNSLQLLHYTKSHRPQ